MKCNESNFIKRLQRKDEQALEYIVDQYLPLIKGIVAKVLTPVRNSGLMEECINDVFLSVWDHSKKFQGDHTDFRKWICSVAKFKAIDYYRKASKKPEYSAEYVDVGTGRSAEDEWINSEERTEIIQLMNTLESVDREIFMMKFFMGCKTEDISKKLGLTKTAIDNRIYRGKRKLHGKAANLRLGENGL
ncbi:sigma-70 family RNA polymerase sigma factor [Bacillus sp. FJAT-42376]|uniref:sigma-70 family RNA polymerase sigma factor n=1 Tax=Bacillus sp. FJAT-42376 TaxID=2014076 RepID=UPI000F4E53E5|nr:sigma-70 family RNA polymerase sigma factor [Bacillus sp. FJAT-42376]AZB41491.1 sigma-70 family RNA polymerase sigma factor [Bacillus sp. FJAT-42376]